MYIQETSGRESREGLVASEQDDTPASTLYTDSQTKRQHHPRYQQQSSPAAAAVHRLQNPVTCRVLMLDNIDYEFSVEVNASHCHSHFDTTP